MSQLLDFWKAAAVWEEDGLICRGGLAIGTRDGKLMTSPSATQTVAEGTVMPFFGGKLEGEVIDL